MTRIETRLGVNTVHAVSVLWQEADGARKHVVFDPSTQARKQSAVEIDVLEGGEAEGGRVLCCVPDADRRAQMQGRQQLA